ncbi:50S ribosomal protein L18e [Candidatus Pacearchaeota archaeon]|nr:50S ribosomal protein L18e [Candidatus Pacearchaeota archaeon]
MTSRTKIKRHLRAKTKPELIETLKLALKNEKWNHIAKLLSYPTRKQSSINLSDIEKQTTPGDTVLIPGKILSKGEITKKVRICALGISETAKEKLKKTKSEYVSILEEINKNRKCEGIKIIK